MLRSALLAALLGCPIAIAQNERPATEIWMEAGLEAIRADLPNPARHSRDLFHVSIALWDSWSAYDASAVGYLTTEKRLGSQDISGDRRESMSHAAYQVLRVRFRNSPGADFSLALFRSLMTQLGYDPDFVEVDGNSAATLGNRVAARVLSHSRFDGANETGNYADNSGYTPANSPLIVAQPGASPAFPNRWQPLHIDPLITLNGINLGPTTQRFLSPHWDNLPPFALTFDDGEFLYEDPGSPPRLGSATDATFKANVNATIRYSSWLDPNSAPGDELLDVGPASNHNNPLGEQNPQGYTENPATGQPYEENLAKRGDYGRVLAEFWANGSDRESLPGLWNLIALSLSSDPLLEKSFAGQGDPLDDEEWSVKLHFALNAALYDAAIASWGAKAFYDRVRPITIIRFMGERGQSSDDQLPSYHPEGLLLEDGLVEIITAASAAAGQRHAHLADHIDKIAIKAWTGQPDDPESQTSGVDWILPRDWMPYQPETYVTPPHAAYVSGHSALSRAAAEILALFTGNDYFPGGLRSVPAAADAFLRIEQGPSQSIELQWATYYDAADEAGISRLWSGLQSPSGDLKGRIMGSSIGIQTFAKASQYYEGTAIPLSVIPSFQQWLNSQVLFPGIQPSDSPAIVGPTYGQLFFFGLPAGGALHESPSPDILTTFFDEQLLVIEYAAPFSDDGPPAVQYSPNLVNWTRIDEAFDDTLRVLGHDGRVQNTHILDPTILPPGPILLRAREP